MTIRLRCAECQRKLKVPDEALGKKVQCPACGARFLGYLEDSAPPPAPPAEAPAAPFPNFQLQDSAAVEEIEPVAVHEPPGEEGVEPIVMEDEPFQELGQLADETEAIEVVEEIEEVTEPEVVEEDELGEKEKPSAKKKKSRGVPTLLVVLGVVLFLVCGVLGIAAYFLF